MRCEVMGWRREDGFVDGPWLRKWNLLRPSIFLYWLVQKMKIEVFVCVAL
jgi:hypothetical protein